MNQTVYIETSILGYLTARLTTNLIVAANIKVTEDWWDTYRNYFTIYPSELVKDEATKGDKAIANQRLESIKIYHVFRYYRRSSRISTSIFTAE